MARVSLQHLHDAGVETRGILLDVENQKELEPVALHGRSLPLVLEDAIDRFRERRAIREPARRVVAHDGSVPRP